MRSLLARLSLGLSLSLIVLFVLQWWVVNTAARTLTEAYVISRLGHDADSILSIVDFSVAGKIEFDANRYDSIYRMPFSGHYYLLQSGEQLQRSRSLWDQAFPAYAMTDEPQYLPGPESQQLLVIVREYTKQGRSLRVVVAEDMNPLKQQLRAFDQRYALISLVVMVLVILLQAGIAKRSLRPLGLVINDMKHLEAGELTELREEVPDEVLPLVKEFNHLLQLMRQRLERSRAALGNLAHALKTPLTVMVQLEENEVLQQRPQLQTEFRDQTNQIRQIIDRQLKRARLAGVSTPGLNFETAKELAGLAQVLRQIYADKDLQIELKVPFNKSFAGDREDMMELFGNLLDNACKWAGRHVLLTVYDKPGLVVSVQDDGPGCAPELRQRLDQRGQRLDESTAGHGLGLAIVRDIVEHYQGSLVFGQSDQLGGFRVDVNLPGRSL